MIPTTWLPAGGDAGGGGGGVILSSLSLSLLQWIRLPFFV
jgi:hypothetical protein